MNSDPHRKKPLGPIPSSKKKRPDGDRARRTSTDLAREALKRKHKAHEWTIDDAPIDFPDSLG